MLCCSYERRWGRGEGLGFEFFITTALSEQGLSKYQDTHQGVRQIQYLGVQNKCVACFGSAYNTVSAIDKALGFLSAKLISLMTSQHGCIGDDCRSTRIIWVFNTCMPTSNIRSMIAYTKPIKQGISNSVSLKKGESSTSTIKYFTHDTMVLEDTAEYFNFNASWGWGWWGGVGVIWRV